MAKKKYWIQIIFIIIWYNIKCEFMIQEASTIMVLYPRRVVPLGTLFSVEVN